MVEAMKEGRADANFLEGMGCPGGCVGGPKAILSAEDGRRNVEEYGKKAACDTPLDNPFVLDLLKRLGFETVEQLLREESIFTRDFSRESRKA
jgi:iron only hydrogenase large subunit-like protein